MKLLPRLHRRTARGSLFLVLFIVGMLSIVTTPRAQKVTETDSKIVMQGTLSRDDAVLMIKALFEAHKAWALNAFGRHSPADGDT